MRTLFSDQAQPFFAQADLIEIGPLTDSEIAEIVDDGFAATDRHPGAVTERIIHFARGHPQRMMQLADAVWRSTDPGRSEEHTSELQSLMRIPYAVFCLKKTKKQETE